MSTMYGNLDNEELQPDASSGPARISKSGILNNIVFGGIAFNQYDSKTVSSLKYNAAEFKFEDEEGLVHTELYFEPPATEEQIKFEIDKYSKIENKMVKTGAKMSKKETLIVLNNELIYFLLDLGNALGYNRDTMKGVLTKATSFKNLIDIFNKNYPGGEKRRISMKLLYDNNDKKKTSFLRLHARPTMYYPYLSDIFDNYIPGRTTALFINKWEEEKCLKQRYTPSDSAPTDGSRSVVQGALPGTNYQPVADTDGEDPF